MKEISKSFWDEKRKILITGSHDRGIKVFQLPLYWPSELVRKYKSKNDKKLLLSNVNTAEENEDFEKSLEKLEDEETRMQNKNPFGKEESELNSNNDNDKNKDNQHKSRLEENENDNDKGNNDYKEEPKGESNFDTTEDDDFLILKSVAKLKQGLSEKEKNCEDLHGWDEDF